MLKRLNTDEEWRKNRRKGIGGSDIAAVMGLNRYKGAVDIFHDKTEPEQRADEPNDAIHFGVILEDVVAREFARRTGMKVQRINATFVDGIRIANIDRAIINPGIAGRVHAFKEKDAHGRHMSTDALLECKTAGARSAWRWGPSQEDEIKAGEVTSEASVPMEYLAQVQWYLGVTGCDVAYIAVLIGGQDFRIYQVKRDDDLIQRMYDIAGDFWKHVETGCCPAPTTAEEAQKVWREDDGTGIEADGDTATALGELLTLKAQAKELSERIAEKEETVKLYIGQHQTLTLDGSRVASWKSGARKVLDSRRLKEDLPDIFSQYSKESKTRTFRLHF